MLELPREVIAAGRALHGVRSRTSVGVASPTPPSSRAALLSTCIVHRPCPRRRPPSRRDARDATTAPPDPGPTRDTLGGHTRDATPRLTPRRGRGVRPLAQTPVRQLSYVGIMYLMLMNASGPP